MEQGAALAAILALLVLNGGASAMTKVEISMIQGPEANTAGEYFRNLRASADLLNLAAERGIINEDMLNNFVHDFRDARNAWDVIKTRRPLLRMMYREAVDYSDILLYCGVIDARNYRALKEILSKGKEFTTRDLEAADHIDSVSARAAAGLEDPGNAAHQILDGLRQMELRKKL